MDGGIVGLPGGPGGQGIGRRLTWQILAAQSRLAISQRELDNHKRQVQNAHTMDQFMCDKYTDQQLSRLDGIAARDALL